MTLTTPCRRCGVWLALLAMLALALAPTISHALAAARGAAVWADICTPQGAQRVLANEPTWGQDGPRSAAGHMEHCAFCGLASHAPPLPLATDSRPALPSARTELPVWLAQVQPAPMARYSAQPRAPPAQF